MIESKFWSIIERAIEVSNNDSDEKEEYIRAELNKLTSKEIFEFGKFFDEKKNQAYRWDLWAAAYIVNGGCGDDSFSDFQASLVAMGKKIYEEALANPDSLAEVEFEDIEEELFFEGYQYIAFTIYEEKTGEDMPSTDVEFFQNPKGKKWDEDSPDDLKLLCPNLFKKYW